MWKLNNSGVGRSAYFVYSLGNKDGNKIAWNDKWLKRGQSSQPSFHHQNLWLKLELKSNWLMAKFVLKFQENSLLHDTTKRSKGFFAICDVEIKLTNESYISSLSFICCILSYPSEFRNNKFPLIPFWYKSFFSEFYILSNITMAPSENQTNFSNGVQSYFVHQFSHDDCCPNLSNNFIAT